jgi:hypothetical protein
METPEKPSKNSIAFDGHKLITSGNLLQTAVEVKNYLDNNPESSVLIFDSTTSQVIDVDFHGTADEVTARLARIERQAPATANLIAELRQAQVGPGRPKLGVVAREVTLLPRHWEWLNGQPGGASVALRKLVEQARRDSSDKDKVRESQESAYRFLSAMGGDLPGYEEALRALYASDEERFKALIAEWPIDVRDHAITVAKPVFAAVGSTTD